MKNVVKLSRICSQNFTRRWFPAPHTQQFCLKTSLATAVWNVGSLSRLSPLILDAVISRTARFSFAVVYNRILHASIFAATEHLYSTIVLKTFRLWGSACPSPIHRLGQKLNYVAHSISHSGEGDLPASMSRKYHAVHWTLMELQSTAFGVKYAVVHNWLFNCVLYICVAIVVLTDKQ